MQQGHRKIPRDADLDARFCHRKIARTAIFLAVCAVVGCAHDRPPTPPASSTTAAPERTPRTVEVETPRELETVAPFHANLGRGAELYLPPWFTAKKGGYDLIVHFHGENRWQVANIERSRLNVAVVSVNLGAGTEPYSKAFKRPESFDRLLADAHAEIVRSGRAQGRGGEAPQLRRLALSAWSAGFSSVSRVMTDAVVQRVDAVLLADGFFTNFTNAKKRTVNARALEKWVKYADDARHDEKLFAITHTTIPTGPYPSVQECVAKLLEMLQLPKTPAVTTGPRDMHQFYLVDQGSFHIRGFEGTRAKDHVKQLHAMGETMYPWLKSRWDNQDAEEAAAAKTASTR